MSSIVPCLDLRDACLISPSQNLFLKPTASIIISVQLPEDVLKTAGKSISTVELMDRIKSAAKPDDIIGLKVLKSTLQYVRFEAHLDSKQQIMAVLQRLDRGTLKLNGLPEMLKMRACEANHVYPSRHEWDSFFQQNKAMDELKPGERPDTVHISMLPCSWFMIPQSSGMEINGSKKLKPSETMLRTLFEVFGPIRAVDIPMLDPYRTKMVINPQNTFAFGQDGFFEAFVQYQEYAGFLNCMTAFRGMKLLFKDGNTAWSSIIQVNFDRTRHLSERSIKYRRVSRERLIQEEIDKERADKVRRELESLKHEESRRQQTEDKLKEETEAAKQKIAEEEAKVALEERKLVLVQRRLESFRLLDAVFERVKAELEDREKRKKDPSKKKDKSKKDKESRRQLKLEEKERTLRAKLLKKYQQVGEQQLEEQRERVRQMVHASSFKLKSSVVSLPDSKNAEKTITIQVLGQSTHLEEESISSSNGNMKQDYGNRQSGYRSQQNQSNDRRNKTDFVSYQNQNHHHRNPNLTRKRHQPSESFHPAARQDQNRSDWKRSRFEGKSNWTSKLDQELWDGPNVEFQRKNSRGGFRHVAHSGNPHHSHRSRDHPSIRERYNNKLEIRHSNTVPGDASENHVEALSVTDRPI